MTQHTTPVDTLRSLLGTLPKLHHERPGIIRSIEVLTHYTPAPAATLTGADWDTIERALFTHRREAQTALARLAKSPSKTRATTYARDRWQRQLDQATTALSNLRIPCEVCGSVANDESGDRLHFAEECFK